MIQNIVLESKRELKVNGHSWGKFSPPGRGLGGRRTVTENHSPDLRGASTHELYTYLFFSVSVSENTESAPPPTLQTSSPSSSSSKSEVFRKSKLSKALSTVRLKLEDRLRPPAGLHCKGRRHQGDQHSQRQKTPHAAFNLRCDTFWVFFFFQAFIFCCGWRKKKKNAFKLFILKKKKK